MAKSKNKSKALTVGPLLTAKNLKIPLPPPHKTVTVTRSFQVDVNIVDVVNWVNSFDDTYTEFSCEGDPGDNATEKPYVLFKCLNMTSLGEISKRFCGDYFSSYGKLEICAPNYFVPYPRFRIEFYSKEVLLKVNKLIKSNKF